MQIPILAGRDFGDQDGATAPCVAIVNQSMAKKYWPRGNAVGGRITLSNKTCSVVGIVGNIIYRNVVWENGDDPVLYSAMLQDYQGWFSVVLRSRTSEYGVLPTLQSAVSSLDGTLPITDVESLSDHIKVSYTEQKIPTEMIAVYGTCCLLVAMVGGYAAIAYSVSVRSREFALRMASGAERSRVLRLVMSSGLRIVGGGLIIGAFGAFFAVHVLKSLLFGVSEFDPASAIFAALLVSGTAVATTMLPARRAASIEPMDALRTE